MEGLSGEEGLWCQDLCNCCLWVLICLTCPISLPLMAAWWCCQAACPTGFDDCCANHGDEGMGFANYADTIQMSTANNHFQLCHFELG